MELRQYLSIVWKWAWLVALSVLIAGGSSFFASRAATPLYRTKTTLMVGRATQNPDPNSSELYTGQQLAYIYSQLARREPVLKGAIGSLGIQMSWQGLAGQVSTYNIPQTQLLEISVVDSDPYRAKVMADAIAQQLILESPGANNSTSNEDADFIRTQLDELKTKIKTGQDEVERLRQELDAANSALQIQDLQNQINVLDTKVSDWQDTYSQLLVTLQGGDVNVLTVVEEATIPSYPISPNVRMNVLLAAAIGLVLAVGGIFLIEYLDDTIKTSEDVQRVTDLTTLGMIGRINGEDYPGKLVAAKNPLDPRVEAFRVLRTNIQYFTVDRPICSLLVTSASPSEGKSVCLANLAVVMAQAGLRVVLVDADMRKPVQHKIFNIANRIGLSDAILHSHNDEAIYLQPTSIENLRLLVSGPQPPNPAKLLESERMKELLSELRKAADIVLIDTPPVLVVADAYILSPQMDGVVLVADAGRTRRNDVKRVVQELGRVHANVLGVVLNRLKGGRGYGYYYYYSEEDGRKKKETGNKRHGLGRWIPGLNKVHD